MSRRYDGYDGTQLKLDTSTSDGESSARCVRLTVMTERGYPKVFLDKSLALRLAADLERYAGYVD